MSLITTLIKSSRYAIFPALLYCVPVVFYLRDDTYSMTWLLSLGNALFLSGMFLLAVLFSGKKMPGNAIVYNGWIVNISSVIISCIVIALLLWMYTPHMQHIAASADPKSKVPPSIGARSTSGLVFMLLANAIIGNFVAGTFATIIARGSFEKK